ncbi:hypothetical protein GW17_00057715, partial [Ensete ventricosum]
HTADASSNHRTGFDSRGLTRRVRTWISIPFACELRAKMASFYQGHVNATQQGAEEEVYQSEISIGQLSGAGIRFITADQEEMETSSRFRTSKGALWAVNCTKISVSKLLRYRERQRRALRKWDAKVIVATPGKQKRRRRRLLGGAVTVWRHGCLRRCCWTGHQSGDRHRPG